MKDTLYEGHFLPGTPLTSIRDISYKHHLILEVNFSFIRRDFPVL